MRVILLLGVAAWLLTSCARTGSPTPSGSQPPSVSRQTQGPDDAQLIEAAKAEGSIVWYTSVELTVAQILAQAFTAKYGVQAEVNRNGSERIFSQFMREMETGVNGADVVHTSDASNFLEMKEKGYLAPYRVSAVDRLIRENRDRLLDTDDQWFALRLTVSNVVYNTNLVREDELPRSWKDLTEPRFRGKLVVAHPSYSGVALTYIQALQAQYGWGYFTAIAEGDPLVVQSVVDVTAKVVSGERPIGAGGNDYTSYTQMKAGQPIATLAMSEGVPFIVSPQGIPVAAPHPNAAKLFLEYSMSKEGQEVLVNQGGVYPVRDDVAIQPDRTPLTSLKLLLTDPAETNRARADIQRQFTDIFGV